jgi:hypothetical protein
MYLVGDNVVVNRFNAVLMGLANYYSGSEYPSALYELFELLRRSCALILSHRHKMRSAKAAFTRWGKDLSIEYKLKKKNEIVTKIASFKLPKISAGVWKTGNLNSLLAESTPKGSILPKSLSGIVSAS